MDADDELIFPKGLCGFPEATRYVVVNWGGDQSPYRLLRSCEVEGLEFLVVDPALFFGDYVVELDDADAEVVGIAEPDEAEVLVIVTLGDPVEESTANLLGPVVIHRRTRAAVQAVQVATTLTSREPLFTRRGPLAAVSG